MFIALAMIIDRKRSLFIDIMYENEVYEAMNSVHGVLLEPHEHLKGGGQILLCGFCP